MNQSHQPASFSELDLIRFMFELNHQSVDTAGLQQMVFDHRRAQNPLTPAAFSPMTSSFSPSNASTPSLTPKVSNSSQIPEPKVVFNYAPQMLTPAPTPSPVESEEIHTTPDTTVIDESDDETKEVRRDKLVASQKLNDWCGNSLYGNIPDVAMLEYDKILRESHTIKAQVIAKIHEEFPISYDYNPNKSRVRTNYEDKNIAEGRTRNNIASRRSRQRKKFQQQILQHSVDYDEDENFLLQKQEKWLKAIIENLEEKFLSKEGDKGTEVIEKLKNQCGFE